MQARYECSPDATEALIRIVPQTDLDKQLLKKPVSDFTVTSMRCSTGARDLFEIRLVRRN